MKLGLAWLIGFAIAFVFGLVTFTVATPLDGYLPFLGGLLAGFVAGFLIADVPQGIVHGFLTGFLGTMAGGIVGVALLLPALSEVPIFGGAIGFLGIIVAVLFGIGAGVLALATGAVGGLLGKRMAPAAAPMAPMPPPPPM